MARDSSGKILTWATDHGFAVLTHDSDLAPGAVQVRIHDVLAETSFDAVAAALGAQAEQLATGRTGYFLHPRITQRGGSHDEAR